MPLEKRKLNKTSIEWVRNPNGSQGYTLSDKTGCTNHTPEGLCLGGLFPCYAYKLANGRLKSLYGSNRRVAPDYPKRYKLSDEEAQRSVQDPFYPRFWEERVKEPYQVKKPIGIFLDDMSDWMLDCWPREQTETELQMMRDNPQHRIYTLTKQPQNLIKFSPFPDNCWVGVTATNTEMFLRACTLLEYPLQAKLKYLSLEPLLDWDFTWNISYLVNTLERADIGWLIIGACTGRSPELLKLQQQYPSLTLMPYGHQWTAQPPIEWLRQIVEAADKAGIKVFLKNNLKPLLEYEPLNPLYWANVSDDERGNERVDDSLRQEMPASS